MTTSTAPAIATTRMVTLLRRPESGGPVPEDFAVEDRPLPALQPGQLLLRNIVMSVDPSMRGRLETTEKHYTTNFEIGQPLDGSAIGVVIDARGFGDRGRHGRPPSPRLAGACSCRRSGGERR